MNDPWDVKSVRQSGQYVSCMKISGVPLLPPVLSKECRKEMQYYKLLAKEVEKRISLLQPHVFDTSSDSEDITDAPELPECENYDHQQEEVADIDVSVDKIKIISPPRSSDNSTLSSPRHVSNVSNITAKENSATDEPKESSVPTSPKYIIDLSLNFNEVNQNVPDIQKVQSPPKDVPERDYNCVKPSRVERTETKVFTQVKIKRNITRTDTSYDDSFRYSNKESDPFSGIPIPQDGPSSLSSKSFTGSLNDLLSESIKDSNIESGKLIRQRSYTLLKPSPQLLAHLEIQSQNTGIEMNSISMSESLSNISSPGKKRRSWDLETAKVKWSNMALELKQKDFVNVVNKTSRTIVKAPVKKITPPRLKPAAPTPTRRNTVTPKMVSKSEAAPKPRKSVSPVRNSNSERGAVNNDLVAKVNEKNHTPVKHVPTPISESDDPAKRVRELYEKIQKQQLVQMATLVEKQKREQILLQQVFEEQNNLLYKQLKTICPKSPIEVKEAWGDKHCDGDRGPVSLSQLINYKSPDQSIVSSPVTSTLTDTNNYINHCDSVLKKSRDITGSLKKQQTKSRSQNGTKIQSPRTQPEGSRTRTHSPVQRNTTSRRLNYDTSASSDRDCEPILTDRTNDTMADLNVTFPSDNSDEVNISRQNNNYLTHGKESRASHGHAPEHLRSTESALKATEHAKHGSNNNSATTPSRSRTPYKKPTPQERAAATKIVAHIKGYLVRRLMRTERVQGTVQTIKDALLCALQLHQDREGIRGADVDLHRRLIQQITAACYSLHDTFITSTPAERCAMIAADRGRRRSLALKQPNNSYRQTDIMSQSHSGSFPARVKRPPPSLMTQSNYETFSGDKSSPVSRRYTGSPRRRPWR